MEQTDSEPLDEQSQRKTKLRLEDYPLEVLEAVLGILIAQKEKRRGAPDGP
jgi:hypothetical protein